MGYSHAMAYHNIEDFEICGLVSRGKSREVLNVKLGNNCALFDNMNEALEAIHP